MHGAHYRLISIQSSQLKLYRGCISLPGLGAICRPLSLRLYQWRSFPGEHLGSRRQSMKWNALGSLLCLLSKHGRGHWSKCVATGCSKQVRDLPEAESLQRRIVFRLGQTTVAFRGIKIRSFIGLRCYYSSFCNFWSCYNVMYLFKDQNNSLHDLSFCCIVLSSHWGRSSFHWDFYCQLIDNGCRCFSWWLLKNLKLIFDHFIWISNGSVTLASTCAASRKKKLGRDTRREQAITFSH